MTEPGPDYWTVDRVERVRVSHPATGKSAEAPTEDEAFGRLTRELARDGDITIGGPRRQPPMPPPGAHTLPGPFAMTPGAEYRFTVIGEWAEILPDLQCRLDRAIYTCGSAEPAAVDLVFRRTPQGAGGADTGGA